MSYIDLPLKFAKAGTMTYAYREAGPTNQRPLVMLHHLSATLDNWDPALIDALSPKVHLLLLDNAGVGASSGQVPPTLQGAARHVVKFIQALDLEEIDLLGISMGGMIAQEVAALIPERIKHLILAGTGPRGGKGIDQVTRENNKFMVKALLTGKNVKEYLFFTRTLRGKQAAKEYLKRIKSRGQQKDKRIKVSSYLRQLRAIHAWGQAPTADFSAWRQPVLIVNGDHDAMVPTENSYVLEKMFPNSQLHIYPDAGHMSIFQNASDFAARTVKFLQA